MNQDMHLIVEASSVEEALSRVSRQWDVSLDDLKAEVVGEGKSFFGLFGKKLKVRVERTLVDDREGRVVEDFLKDKDEEDIGNAGSEKQPLLCKSRGFLTEILGYMNLRAAPELPAGESNMVCIEGQDADILVGRRGDGLKALEYLLNLALRSPGEEPRIRLDSGGYRERRKQSLERLAEVTARRVVQRGTPLRLEPMLSWERWVIHTTLKDRIDVQTQSVGEAPDRKVVVMPRIGDAERQESFRRPPRNSRARDGRRR